jgi:hypothetical protein
VGGRSSSPGQVTATERSVADLVATGRSNEEVARTLFMSSETVDWNLTKVYRKATRPVPGRAGRQTLAITRLTPSIPQPGLTLRSGLRSRWSAVSLGIG